MLADPDGTLAADSDQTSLDRAFDRPEIAAALGVANILEGSVRLAGNQVRITTQLIEAESDAHLWTETYDRELTATNIFSIIINKGVSKHLLT